MITAVFFAALIALYQNVFFYQVIDAAEYDGLGGFAVFGPFCRCESPLQIHPTAC